MLDINEDLIRKPRHFIQLLTFKTFIFTGSSLVFAFILYLFDSGPVLPPFPDNNSDIGSIDCHSISYLNHTVHDGLIDFYCHQSETIQFPNEYLPHFISLSTKVNDISMKFNKDQLKNMSLINETIKFSLMHPISGDIDISLKCLNKEFSSQKIFLNEVNETDDGYFSTKGDNGPSLARMTNVCFEKFKFLFFAQQSSGQKGSIPFNRTNIPFEILGWFLPAYQLLKNVTKTNETALLLPSFDTTIWKTILFNLLPISLSLEKNNESFTRKFHFLFRDIPLKGSADIVKRFTSFPPTKIKDIQCFKRIILPASFSINKMETESINLALNQNFSYLRKIFLKNPINNNKGKKIVVSNSLSAKLLPVINEICGGEDNCNIVVQSATSDVCKQADLVSTAHIFVGNHLVNLINMVFLTPNRTAVIDATPTKLSCNRWAENLAKRNDINYYRANKLDENCECTDFECYPIGPGNDVEVDVEMFRAALKDALIATNYEEPPPETTKEFHLPNQFLNI